MNSFHGRCGFLKIKNDDAGCLICGEKQKLAKVIGICPTCLKNSSTHEIEHLIKNIHSQIREELGLEPSIPRMEKGITCNYCSAKCRLQEGQWGWCGLRKNENGRFLHLSTREKGILYHYLDPHITNCCNAWFCPAGTGCGHPKHAVKPRAEVGFYNLALFCYGCSFNCLFCQNWEHKLIKQDPIVTVNELIKYTLTNRKITCWCWFGGSVEPQFLFVLNASKQIVRLTNGKRILRVCFEWNGDGNPRLVEKAAQIAHISGGNIKFDFKAWDVKIHLALTGRRNDQVIENTKLIHDKFWNSEKNQPPVLGITSLLVPYYVDSEEIEQIASFLANLDPNIPYSLLIFHPDFQMNDLPVTPLEQLIDSYKAASEHLNNVNIGNLHLIGLHNINEVRRMTKC